MAERTNPAASAAPPPSQSSAAGPYRPSRSQSLTTTSSPANSTVSLFPTDSSASNSPSSPGPGPTAPEPLIRRHHTVSTPSSRLIRGERSKARLALQGAGLSEEDQKYYLPDSPVTAAGGGWADARSEIRETDSKDMRRDSTGATLATMVEGASSRSGGVSPALSAHSSTGTGNSGRGGSAFVVVRASKGDAPLSERKENTRSIQPDSSSAEQGSKRRHPVVTPPRHAPLSVSLPAHATSFGGFDNGRTTSPAPMESWNSLREAEGSFEGDAEWEKSLLDEKARLFEEEDTVHRPATRTSPPMGSSPSSPAFQPRTSSPFNPLPSPLAHSRSQTSRAIGSYSSSAWLGNSDNTPDIEAAAALRRRQSLNFRSEGNERWNSADDPTNRNEDRPHLASASLASSTSFANSRVRAGTAPGLSLSLSIAAGGDNHSRHSSGNGGLASPGSSLAYSTSLNSHHAHPGLVGRSNSLHAQSSIGIGGGNAGNGSGAISPIGVYPRSPWSPTVEEANQLGKSGNGMNEAGLTRRESGDSKGSGSIGRLVGRVMGEGLEGAEVESPTGSNGSGGFGSNGSASHATTGPTSTSTYPTDGEPRRALSTHLPPPSRRTPLPPLQTNADILASLATPIGTTPGSQEYVQSFLARQGPASAAALFAPQIGHSHLPQSASQSYSTPSQSHQPPTQNTATTSNFSTGGQENQSRSVGKYSSFTANPLAGGTDWTRQKELLVGNNSGSVTSNPAPFIPSLPTLPSLPSLATPSPTTTSFPQHTQPIVGGSVSGGGENWPAGGGFGVGLAIRQQEQIVVLQNQMQALMQTGAQTSPPLNQSSAQSLSSGISSGGGGIGSGSGEGVSEVGAGMGVGPIDIAALILEKGYNPPTFDLKPTNARFFVIKSYTEEDVHKSLKYEIWASTTLGNQRLDRAFRESGDKGPIYLFFSVNASGHFAGMAQMLSPVDYTTSSTVWASDKWKGVLKLRWIYIKDVPLASLRHIRLSNTPENKPVTSSRDTQEVPYDAGCEVLRILSSYQSRTSLLQDFAWYEQRQEAALSNPTAAAVAGLTTEPNAGGGVASGLVPRTITPSQNYGSSSPFGGSPSFGGSPHQSSFQPRHQQQQQQQPHHFRPPPFYAQQHFSHPPPPPHPHLFGPPMPMSMPPNGAGWGQQQQQQGGGSNEQGRRFDGQLPPGAEGMRGGYQGGY